MIAYRRCQIQPCADGVRVIGVVGYFFGSLPCQGTCQAKKGERRNTRRPSPYIICIAWKRRYTKANSVDGRVIAPILLEKERKVFKKQAPMSAEAMSQMQGLIVEEMFSREIAGMARRAAGRNPAIGL